MNPGMRQASILPPDMAEEGAIKSWLDALASGRCDAPTFLRATMQSSVGADEDVTWEVLSQLDQYYRRGRIETEVFQEINTALAESAMGLSTIPARKDKPELRPAPPAREVTAPRQIPTAREVPAPREVTAAREVPAARAVPAVRAVPAPRTVPEAREVPALRGPAVARDSVAPSHLEHTDTHARREEMQASDSAGYPQPGDVLRGRYRIEAVVGQGRMGTVFQVLDEFRLEAPGTQRLAVKVFHPAVAKSAELQAELRREFQSLQLLSHPNIVRVFDFDRDGPLVFFTMELLIGAPLGRVLQARKLIPLQRPQALAVIRDVGAALAYAHACGAVHGNLDPQNIFVTASGELRVMSFGSSHNARENFESLDQEITPRYSASIYASCQVIEGERADARDDVFSLACIAYLLLSGSHPFPMCTAMEARHAKLRPRRPANLSGRQWQALRGALHWKRENRPADVQKWLREMELRGAAKRLAPLNDLLRPPSTKKFSWFAAGMVAAVALLLSAGYWLSIHRDGLPSLDSSASIQAPVSRAPPAATEAAPPANGATPAPSPPPSERAKPPSVAAPAAAPIAAPLRAAPPMAAPAVTAATGAPRIELAADTVDVPSGQPSAVVTVHRRGSLRGETKFTWWTESGTAKPGADFSPVVPQLAYIADGKSSVALSVPLRSPPRAQSKSFYVVIDQSEGGAALGARSLTLVTLLPRQ